MGSGSPKTSVKWKLRKGMSALPVVFNATNPMSVYKAKPFGKKYKKSWFGCIENNTIIKC